MPVSREQAGSTQTAGRAVNRVIHLSPMQAGGIAAAFALCLSGVGFLDVVRPNPVFQWSFLGSGLLLLAWAGVLFGWAKWTGRTLDLEVALRKQHIVQALAQGVFFLYWGWYWRPVYDSAFLILAQLVFAYGFTMVLCWSRRDLYTLGLGPFPVIFSINLFLWFRDDWFYLQFLLVALGFLAKEVIQWTKGGQRVHIFNPSSFPLAIFSLALILTGTSDLTWGQDIATSQFYPPHVYLVLFLVALPGQYLFGVASMTLSAVVATYLFGLFYFGATGVYFFYDSYIPIAVFLGMHLLFTDPSTAPRTEVGRLMFGALYGLSTVALYALLSHAGVPPFYDKLLQVPVLNLSIQLLDRMGRSKRFQGLVVGAYRSVLPLHGETPCQQNLVSIGVWAVVFTAMSLVQAVGDRHPGQWVPFWQAACREGRPDTCRYLTDMQLRFCRSGSGWACNEAARLYMPLVRSAEDRPWIYRSDVEGLLGRGCDLGFGPACQNLAELNNGGDRLEQAPATLADYPIVLRGSKGPVVDRSPTALYARACSQGWLDLCGRATEDSAK